ncbi:hypothetical protein HOH87_05895 [bacterium]|jgi:hypothetical protein|nr:hypothetical protein [bacterium]
MAGGIHNSGISGAGAQPSPRGSDSQSSSDTNFDALRTRVNKREMLNSSDGLKLHNHLVQEHSSKGGLSHFEQQFVYEQVKDEMNKFEVLSFDEKKFIKDLLTPIQEKGGLLSPAEQTFLDNV